MSKIELFNEDCMIGMARYPDKYFELAIVDPPYNVGASDGMFGAGPGRGYRYDLKHYINHDKTPDMQYFNELFRVSQNQIIWGMNYYPQYLYHSGAIVWIKKDSGPLSDAEIAFQSFSKLVKIFESAWSGFNKGPRSYENDRKERIHPNQKPLCLYEWLLKNYAKQGDKILDTHGGSMSIAIACYNLDFDLTLFEIDKDYFEAGKRRLEEHKRQRRLFDVMS